MKESVFDIEIVKKISLFLITLCFFGLFTQAHSDETDDYLSRISSEAQKVDAEHQPPTDTKEAAPALSKQQEFEEILKDQHRGSYPIYSRLSSSAKIEVYKVYKSGVPFDKVRRKIITLYSNQ
jgi:hypothetical protein